MDKANLPAPAALQYRADPGPPPRLVFIGRMDAHGIGPLWAPVLARAEQLVQAAQAAEVDPSAGAGQPAGGKALHLDLSAVDYCDGAGAALLHRLMQLAQARGVPLRLQGLTEGIEGHLRPYREAESVVPARSPQAVPWTQRLRRGVAAVGHEIHVQVAFIGEYSLAVASALRHPRQVRWGDTLRVAEAAGFQALPIVSLIAFLLGVILAFQSAIAMRQFGAEIFVADLVSISLLRELAPLMMAILLAGRTGAAFAAEIGTMKVNEEINALSTMGLDPVRFLVVPKILAGIFVAPLLTLYANLIGLFGAALVMRGFGIPMVTFFNQVSGAVDLSDLGTGLFKAAVFGLLVSSVGCLRGLQTGNGAEAVGRATTSAVVSAIILIVVADGLFAVLFFQLGI